jgi:hypothetical protein
MDIAMWAVLGILALVAVFNIALSIENVAREVRGLKNELKLLTDVMSEKS